MADPTFVGHETIKTSNQTSLKGLTDLLREKRSADTVCLCLDQFSVDDDYKDCNDPVCLNDFGQALLESTSIQKLTIDIPEKLSSRYCHLAQAAIRHLPPHVQILELKPRTIHGDSFRKILDVEDETLSISTPRRLFQRISTLQITCSFAYHSFQSYHDHEVHALCDWMVDVFGRQDNKSNSNINLTTFRLEGYRVHSHRRLLTTLHSSLGQQLRHISLSGHQAYLDGRREPQAECASLEQLLRMPRLETLELTGLVLALCHATTLAGTLLRLPQTTKTASSFARHSLQHLSLKLCRFPDEGGHVIAAALEQTNSPLKSLTIQSQRIGTSRMESLIPLKDISPRLEILRLTCAELNDAACNRISQRLLASSSGPHRLKELHLDSCQISLNGMSVLMQSLQCNDTLQVLSIHNVYLGDSCVSVELAAALEANCTLQSLTLDACSLSDDCLERLVDSIVRVSHCASLRTVKLSHHTGVSNRTIASCAIPKLLQCKKLFNVDLSGVIGDPLSDKQGAAALDLLTATYEVRNFCIDVENKDIRSQIETVARLNKAGRRYLTTDMSSRRAGVCVLSKVNNNLNDVFTHLQENPSLCS